MLNKEAAKSPYVTYEWAFGLGSNKTIIPILAESCEVHPRINVLQHLDFSNKQRPWEKLVARIKQVKSSGKKVRVGDLTVEELEKLLTGSKDLAVKSASDEGRQATNDEVAGFANQIVTAKNLFESSSIAANNILWVDDRPNNNTYERDALGLIGFKFDLALSTNEALSLLSHNKYAAVISDMGRREGPKEGYVLLNEFRKTNKNTPFFIYAASSSPERKAEALAKGAQGATNRSAELLDLITKYVRPSRA